MKKREPGSLFFNSFQGTAHPASSINRYGYTAANLSLPSLAEGHCIGEENHIRITHQRSAAAAQPGRIARMYSLPPPGQAALRAPGIFNRLHTPRDDRR